MLYGGPGCNELCMSVYASSCIVSTMYDNGFVYWNSFVQCYPYWIYAYRNSVIHICRLPLLSQLFVLCPLSRPFDRNLYGHLNKAKTNCSWC